MPTAMLALGYPMPNVQKWMAHTSTAMTPKAYAVAIDLSERDTARLRALVDGADWRKARKPKTAERAVKGQNVGAAVATLKLANAA